MKQFYFSIILLFSFQASAQEIITGTFDFQTDPEKKYALYIPSEYSSDTPTKVILGLHPWNTSKWDSESWALELSEVAEANNCIVICPDGGADGQIDDDIDTSFTSFLMEEVAQLYNLDQENIYAVGFSWGAKTVYTYGLNHVNKFAGFMPIGAAVEAFEVSSFQEKAKDKPFYIIHGSQDSPAVRFHPLVDMMTNNMACVETNLLSGVGHTVEFPDQFNILNTGLQWLLEANCNVVNPVTEFENSEIKIKANNVRIGTVIEFQSDHPVSYRVMNSVGDMICQGKDTQINQLLSAGIYFIQIENQEAIKLIVTN